jgi:acetyl esterase
MIFPLPRSVFAAILLGVTSWGAGEETAYFEMAYRTEEPALMMRIYRPVDWKEDDNRPAVVFFFGGGWKAGTPDQFDAHCRRLSELGMVAMAAEYRVSSKHDSTPLDSFEDAKAAIRWVRENADIFGINPERIAAAGGSAGGHLAAAVSCCRSAIETETRDTPDAIVGYNPALNLLVPQVEKSWGADVYSQLETISALQNLDVSLPPMLLFHGEADQTIPIASIREFVAKAKEIGVVPAPVLVSYPGKDHGFFNVNRGEGVDYEDTMTRTISFFRELGWIK